MAHRYFAVLTTAMALACSNGDDSNPVSEVGTELVGTWVAISTTNVESSGFGGVVMVVRSDGTFTQSFQGEGYEYSASGMWSSTDGRFSTVFDPIDDSITSFSEDYAIVQDRLVLVDVDGSVEIWMRVTDTSILAALSDSLNSNRPSEKTWSELVETIGKSVYWIGYTARPEGTVRCDLVFVGTGFAVHPNLIATNYHVGQALTAGFENVRSDIEPVAVAIQAGSSAYGDGTYFLGSPEQPEGDLFGFWDSRYDRTTASPDIAVFLAQESDSRPLTPVSIAAFDHLLDLKVGDEIGVLGFPGILEEGISPSSLTPNPTFKSGTISALRPYEDNPPFSSNNASQVALLGKIVQHNLETVPGNSGSPIFNTRGEVVAIHNAGIRTGDAFAFAIRADEIRLLMKSVFADAPRPPNAKPMSTGNN
jgi:V8-like Glu-specific endopeptidase